MIRGTTSLGVGSTERPPSAIPLDFARGFGKNRAGFLEKREKGRTPVVFVTVKKEPALCSLVKLAHPPVDQLPEGRLSVLILPTGGEQKCSACAIAAERQSLWKATSRGKLW
jgi:hypothetical protein